jgi:hypothetical protein
MKRSLIASFAAISMLAAPAIAGTTPKVKPDTSKTAKPAKPAKTEKVAKVAKQKTAKPTKDPSKSN